MLAAGSDVLLCEATSQGEPGPDRHPYHLFAVEAAALARDAGAPSLLLTHLAPGLDPRVSVREAKERFDGDVAWAAPGLEVIV